MRGRGRGGREGAQGGRAAERRHARVPPARVRGRRDLNGGERTLRAAAGPRAARNTRWRRAALAQRCPGRLAARRCPKGARGAAAPANPRAAGHGQDDDARRDRLPGRFLRPARALLRRVEPERGQPARARRGRRRVQGLAQAAGAEI